MTRARSTSSTTSKRAISSTSTRSTSLATPRRYDKVIRRELKIHEGELYNGTKLRLSRENVERLGYFAPGEVIFNTVTPKGKQRRP